MVKALAMVNEAAPNANKKENKAMVDNALVCIINRNGEQKSSIEEHADLLLL